MDKKEMVSKAVGTAGKYSGTLKYISTGALPPTWGNGNFLALKWLGVPSDATECTIGIENQVSILNDPERCGTVKVSDITKKLKVITTTPAGTNTQEYDLSGLILEEAPQNDTREEDPEENETKSTKKK